MSKHKLFPLWQTLTDEKNLDLLRTCNSVNEYIEKYCKAHFEPLDTAIDQAWTVYMGLGNGNVATKMPSFEQCMQIPKKKKKKETKSKDQLTVVQPAAVTKSKTKLQKPKFKIDPVKAKIMQATFRKIFKKKK